MSPPVHWAVCVFSPTGQTSPAIVCIRRYEIETYSSKNTTRTHVSHTTSQKKNKYSYKKKWSFYVSNFSLSERERSPRPGEPGRRSRRQHLARGEPRTGTAAPPGFPRRRASTIRGYAAAISPRFIPRLPLVRHSAAWPQPPPPFYPCTLSAVCQPSLLFSISYSCFVFISLRICHIAT